MNHFFRVVVTRSSKPVSTLALHSAQPKRACGARCTHAWGRRCDTQQESDAQKPPLVSVVQLLKARLGTLNHDNYGVSIQMAMVPNGGAGAVAGAVLEPDGSGRGGVRGLHQIAELVALSCQVSAPRTCPPRTRRNRPAVPCRDAYIPLISRRHAHARCLPQRSRRNTFTQRSRSL